MHQFWAHNLPLVLAVAFAIVSGASVFLSLMAFLARLEAPRPERMKVGETLESRPATVAGSMARASELLVLVQTEIEARAAKAKQLAAEVKKGEQLALLTQPQKDAVAAVLRGEIAAEGRRSIWWTVGVSALTLVFGSAITVVVTLLVHPLH
jgi:hypothetical protein